MAWINSRSLFRWPAILRLSGDSPGRPALDDSSPIQRVLDIGRQAELNAVDIASGFFFQVGNDNIHAGADTQDARMDPYSTADGIGALGLTANDFWVWLMWAATSADAAIITSARLGVELAAWGQLARRDFLVGMWDSTTVMHTDLSATFPRQGILLQATTAPNPPQVQWPFPVFPGSKITFQSVSSAAGTIRLSTICAVLPRGVFPPGMS